MQLRPGLLETYYSSLTFLQKPEITLALSLAVSYGIYRYLYLPLIRSPINSKSYFAGPAADPIIGHARAMPREYAWKTFTDWRKRFGDTIYLHVLGRSILILNSLESVKEVLDKHSANNSDRPRFVYFQEILGWGDMLVFMHYGERFRTQRKMLQQFWNSQKIISARPTQRAEVHKLLVKLLQSPADYDKCIEHSFSSALLMTTYGYEVCSENDPLVNAVVRATQLSVESGNPGSMPVDIFPFLKNVPSWFPGAGFQRHGLKTRIVIRDMLDRPYEMVKNERAKGTARPSFLREMMEDYEREGVVNLEHEENMKTVAGVLYGAGVETTNSTFMTFLLALILNPSVSKKAQEEIDRVVGTDRLPDFDDRGDMPYLECILRETFRWYPALPLGVPHSSIKEDTYKGKQIPAESMIIPNIWGILRDPETYSNPNNFDPDRFLNRIYDGKTGKLEDSTTSEAFGFGRRVCPGRYYADAGIWLTMACILACFEIRPGLDKYGKEIIPDVEFTNGFTTRPKPFQCRFVLRNPKYEKLIRQTQY